MALSEERRKKVREAVEQARVGSTLDYLNSNRRDTSTGMSASRQANVRQAVDTARNTQISMPSTSWEDRAAAYRAQDEYDRNARMAKVAQYSQPKISQEQQAVNSALDYFNTNKRYGLGNIDLYNRPQYRNENGSVSTVRSLSFGTDEGEILVPTIARDNNGNPVLLSDDEAIQRYFDTGEYLGKFDTVEDADRYAEALHEQQAIVYNPNRTGQGAYHGTSRVKPTQSNVPNALGNEDLRRQAEEFNRTHAPQSIGPASVDEAVRSVEEGQAYKENQARREHPVRTALFGDTGRDAMDYFLTAKLTPMNYGKSLDAVANDSTGNPYNQNPYEVYDLSNVPENQALEYARAAQRRPQNPLTVAEENARTNPDPDESIKQYTFMTDDEKTYYNALYGLRGPQEAEAWHNMMLDEINARIAKNTYDNDVADQSWLRKGVTAFGEGVESGLRGLSEVPNALIGSTRSKATPVSSYVASQIAQDPNNRKAEKVFYDIMQSTGYMTPGIVAGLTTGGAGNLVFALSQYGNSYRQAINSGETAGTASLYSMQQAVDESVTNWMLGGIQAFGGGAIQKFIGDVGADKFAALLDRFGASARGKEIISTVMGFLADMGGEAAQEYVQYFTENWTQALLGMKDADGNRVTANLNMLNPEALYSALVGALNAGFLNSVPTATELMSIPANAPVYTPRINGNQYNPDVYTAYETGTAPSDPLMQLAEEAAAQELANTEKYPTVEQTDDDLFSPFAVYDNNTNEGVYLDQQTEQAINARQEDIERRASVYPDEAAEIYRKYVGDIDDIVSYDSNMHKAFQAGINGDNLASLMNDTDDFADFYMDNPKAVDEMFKAGYAVYVQRENNQSTVPNGILESAANPGIKTTPQTQERSKGKYDSKGAVTAANGILKESKRDSRNPSGAIIDPDTGKQYIANTYMAVILDTPNENIPAVKATGTWHVPEDNRKWTNVINSTLGAARKNQESIATMGYPGLRDSLKALKNTKSGEILSFEGMDLFNFDGNRFASYPNGQTVDPEYLGYALRMLQDPVVYYGDSERTPVYVKGSNGEAVVFPIAVRDAVRQFLKAGLEARNRQNTLAAEPAKESKPSPEAKPEVKAAPASKPQSSIADSVLEMLTKNQSFTMDWLFKVADKAYGGTQAQGAYTVKDAYDGMELGINKYLMNADFVKAGNGSLAKAQETLSQIQKLLNSIPTQTKRTAEQESFQQFSTPPSIAYTAARVANINANDVILEPSAGIGGLALWGKAWGATVYGNELSERRLAFLNELGLDGTFNENAEQINNVLPDNIKPTVVIMNPPFSSTAGRLAKNDTKNAKRHIEQALDRLEEGGRLVAILGRGMADDAPSFKSWWNDLRKEYNVLANVRIDGSNYKKYGTSFDDQLVVIDKTGPQTGETITGEYKELPQLITDLEGVRDARTQISGSDRGIVGSVSDRVPESGRSGGDVRPVSVSSTAGGSASANGQRTPAADDGERSGSGRLVASEGGKTSGKTPKNGVGRPGAAKPGISGSVGGSNEQSVGAVGLVKGSSAPTKKKDSINIDSTFTSYHPEKVNIAGSKPHPGNLVESAAMGAVTPPDVTYSPHLSQDLIDKGVVSDAQLENIVYAGQAHTQKLSDGRRKGYFIGDGTGVGKGRQLAAIIQDNFNQGRKKALWISKNWDLVPDAKRDWKDLGGDPKDVYELRKVKKGNSIPYGDGILFGTYDTLGSQKEAGIQRLKEWLGEDFDGVIALDEAHMMAHGLAMKGKRGKVKPSERALWGIELQRAFPNARVVYATATGASSPENLVYLDRLGLWGPGTAFANFEDFYTKISNGGLAAMELVARDMKAMGVYLARSISYDGVEYSSVEHELTPMQNEIYNKMSDAWQVVLQNINKALEITGQDKNGNAKGAASSAFWGGLQRFYNQVITSMSMPSVIDDIRGELENGRSVVIQLTNTNEAQANRAIAKNAEAGGDLEDLDLTPSETLIQLLEKSFPVQAYEEYTDENGNVKSRPIFDKEGNPVLDKKAVALRDKLIEEVGMMQVPDGPLEMLLDAFGTDMVAEVTGRSRRVVYQKQPDGSVKRVIEKRSSASAEADANAFQDGKKRILVFSEKGGTGKSYHADLRAKNQQQRVHYLLQPGWKADAAIQGLGRTHRTNEASQPIYKLVTTNVMGQKRFTSTIARRLNQMGALTKGQRDAGSGVFSERDNLENPIAMDALSRYYRSADKALLDKLGIKIYDSHGAINESSSDLRDISKFLNRILALNVEDQNTVFEDFYSTFEQMMDAAIANGTVEMGMESFKADKVDLIDETTIRKDPSGADTQYVQMKVYNKPKVVKYSDLKNAHRGFVGLYRLQDGSVRAVYELPTQTDARGNINKRYRLDTAVRGKFSTFIEKTLNEQATPIPKDEWSTAWKDEIASLPEYDESTLHMLTGTLLPIWNKLPETNTRVMRVVTNDGKQYLGRIINPEQIDSVLRNLGTKRTQQTYTTDQLMSEVLDKNKEIAFRDNKWKVNRRRVSGEWRLEITGNNLWALTRISPDIITERINYNYRYFIPTGPKGKAVLDKIIQGNPVVDVRTSASADDGSGIQQLRQNAAPKRESYADQWEANRVGDTDKTPMRVSDIIAKARHDLGISITAGHIRGNDVRGQYNNLDHGVRSKIANDLPAIAHEIGHHFDNLYSITEGDLPEAIENELKKSFATLEDAGYGAKAWKKEGWAEYIRRFLQNRETAAIDYPELTKRFLESLSAEDLVIVEQLADEINAYYSLDADTATSSLRAREDSVIDYRSASEKIHDMGDSIYQAWIDSNHSIKRFDRALGGNAYVLATNSAYSDAIAGRILTSDLTDPDGNYVAPGLKTALAGIDTHNRETYAAFNEYLACLHGQEWLSQGKRVFADDRKNSQLFMSRRVYELGSLHPEFEEAAKRLIQFVNDFNQTWGVNTGLIPQEIFDSWGKMYPNYVPFFRATERHGSGGARRGFANQTAPYRRAKGSGQDIIYPVDGIIDQVVKVVNTATRNNVMLAMRDAAIKSGDATFMSKVPEPLVPKRFNISGIKESIAEGILNKATQGDILLDEDSLKEIGSILGHIEDIQVQFEQGHAKGNVVTVLVDGKPEFWEINDPELLKSITSLSPAKRNAVLEFYAMTTRFMTSMITGSNPIWSVFSNAPRDIQTLAMYAKDKTPAGYARLIRDIGSGYLNAFRDRWKDGEGVDPLYAEYMALGGGDSSAYSADRNLAKKYRKTYTRSKAGRLIDIINPLEWVSFISDTIERGPRYATYKACRTVLGMDSQEAFYNAMDVTVNFRRSGENSRDVNKVAPFFNANVQGTDKFMRYFAGEDVPKQNRAKAVTGRLLMWTVASAVLAGLNYALNFKDDESKKDYNRLSDYTKNSYFCIPLGDGKYFAIPKGRELLALESLFSRILEYGNGNVFAFEEFGDYFTTNMLPSILSDVAQYPINFATKGGHEANEELFRGVIGSLGLVGLVSDIRANADFLGRPIVSKTLSYYDPARQYNGSTSKLAKKIGETFNWSPALIDHFGNNFLSYPWKFQRALLPVDKRKRDLTLGIGNTYNKDNIYSTDSVNWLYDKAEKSAQLAKDSTDMNKKIDAKMDSNMTTFYSRFYSLNKDSNDASGRKARQGILTMIEEYREISKLGNPQEVEKVYDIVRAANDTGLLPSVMQNYVKDANKEKIYLTDAEYVEYQLRYNGFYWTYVNEYVNPLDDMESQIAGLKKAGKDAKTAADEYMLKKVEPQTPISVGREPEDILDIMIKAGLVG